MAIHKIKHNAPFDLRNQNDFFGGWPVLKDSPDEFSIVIAFPVEGWKESTAVVVSQNKSGELSAEVHGAKDEDAAIDQVRRCLSLNVDDSDWLEVGKRDKVIGELQQKYHNLRPTLFHSPYEAACSFIIGQRISINQRRVLMKKMSEAHGQKFTIDGQEFYAFPSPDELLKITNFKGLNPNKIERIHGVAQAAIEGPLTSAHLLSLKIEAALDYLLSLNGIGPFYAQAILYRGSGLVDGIADDDLTKYAIAQAYHLDKEPNYDEVLKIAENWKPYRMWCAVLLHVWMRREIGMPKRR